MKRQHMAILILCLFNISVLSAQGHEERFNSIDVLQYTFEVELNDENEQIKGIATILISFRKPLDQFRLDLQKKDKEGLGMVVSRVSENGTSIDFDHKGNKLTIKPEETTAGEERTYIIEYQGEPQDGMIIGDNKYFDRTFFADHWPDRAHHWLPCVDHPSDRLGLDGL